MSHLAAIGKWLRTSVLACCVLAGALVCGVTAADETHAQAVVNETSTQVNEGGDSESAARQQLDEILRDPIFHRWELGRDEDSEFETAWLDSIRMTADAWRLWLEDFFSGWFPQNDKTISHAQSASWVTGAMFKIIAYILAGLLLIFVVVALIRMLRITDQDQTTRILSRKRLHEALEQGQALATDSRQWIAEAQQLAQDNDLRLAYRAMYLALLSGLHQQRDIDFHQQRTNWTYVEQFRGEADSRKTFAGLTEMFDDVWYGLGQPETQQFQAVQQQIDALLSSRASKEAIE